ncbi:hypothetical protein PIB30_029864 [Stylosanthes scabra]|uniref:Uncharacterized protein n=1 Tax=Stylosanthes scabra TaxID=79078 RepID=A0ABU6YDB8_9FABA|nr:hypothetical protein [Stylosanthes scabra]
MEFRIVKNLKLLLDGYGGFSSTPLQLELGGIWEGYTVKEIKGRVVGSTPVHLIEPVKIKKSTDDSQWQDIYQGFCLYCSWFHCYEPWPTAAPLMLSDDIQGELQLSPQIQHSED